MNNVNIAFICLVIINVIIIIVSIYNTDPITKCDRFTLHREYIDCIEILSRPPVTNNHEVIHNTWNRILEEESR